MRVENGEMICKCGGDYIGHILEVNYYRRDREDGDFTSILASPEEITIKKNEGSNPSGRRSGFEFTVKCESCHGLTTIKFAEHKGKLLVEEEFSGLKVLI